MRHETSTRIAIRAAICLGIGIRMVGSMPESESGTESESDSESNTRTAGSSSAQVLQYALRNLGGEAVDSNVRLRALEEGTADEHATMPSLFPATLRSGRKVQQDRGELPKLAITWSVLRILHQPAELMATLAVLVAVVQLLACQHLNWFNVELFWA